MKKIMVVNKGNKTVIIGSQIHFFNVSKSLVFEREQAYGMRLNLQKGESIKFEAGERKEVELTEIEEKKDFVNNIISTINNTIKTSIK